MQKHELSENFYSLTPDHFMDAVEQAGLVPTGEYIQLNSYENRVFDIHLEEGLNPPALNGRIIAKFYRPHRWSEEAILEEHQFLLELQQHGVPAIAAWEQRHGKTVNLVHNMYFALFPKALGRMPQELNLSQLRRVGRALAHLHNIGEQQRARHRLTLDPEVFGWPSLDVLENWVAEEVWERYDQAAHHIFNFLDQELAPTHYQRIHGDCHKGNLLMTDQAGEKSDFFFVDFDDFCNGPVVQDFWMLFSSSNLEESFDEQEAILDGYKELRQFDRRELKLIPALRALRIVHYSAWIARRWSDPNFPRLFPQFEDYSYWATEAEALEQIAWSL